MRGPADQRWAPEIREDGGFQGQRLSKLPRHFRNCAETSSGGVALARNFQCHCNYRGNSEQRSWSMAEGLGGCNCKMLLRTGREDSIRENVQNSLSRNSRPALEHQCGAAVRPAHSGAKMLHPWVAQSFPDYLSLGSRRKRCNKNCEIFQISPTLGRCFTRLGGMSPLL